MQSLAIQTGSALSEISIIFTLKSLGFLLGSFFVGRLYDRISSHPIVAVVMLGAAAALFLTPVMDQLVLLGTVILLMGFCMGSLDIGGNTLLVWVHREKVGPYMNGLHFIWGLGAALTPLILGWFSMGGSGDSIADWGVRRTYWLIALLLIPIALWILRLPSPRATTENSTTDDSYDDSGEPLLLALLALFYFLYIGAEVSITGWIVTYTTQTALADQATANYLNSAFFIALTATRLVMIPLAARFRSKHILTADLLICIASAALMMALPLTWPAILIGIIGLGIGMSSIFPMMLTFAQNRMSVTGKTTSWIFLGASAGGMTVPWVVGQLFESVSPQVVLVAILACVVGTALLFWVINQGWERKAQG